MNTISEEEITSDEELTAGVGNLAVDAQKRTKQQTLKVHGLGCCFIDFYAYYVSFTVHKGMSVGVYDEMIKLDERRITGAR